MAGSSGSSAAADPRADVGAGHLHPLSVPGPSPLHALCPHTKVVATLLFVLAVVSTPREAVWAFAAHALVIAGLARVGGVPGRVMARRLVLELPFVAFAALLPFFAAGARIDVLGVAVSREGLWAAWGIIAKGTLGLAASLVLVATTPTVDLLRGLERLKVPPVFTAIASFMLRYVEVIAAELRRLQVARISRGHDPRWLGQAGAMASTVGALFVRTFERGERVHLAMVARGYTGALPFTTESTAAALPEWTTVLLVPLVAATIERGGLGAPLMPAGGVVVRGLAYAYPSGRQALYGIDLEVAPGERVAVLGPNGAGKTTFVLHLNGILTPGAGSVEVGGLPVAAPHLQEVRRRVGVVFQDPDDQLFMPTVRDDVAFGPANLGYRGADLDARVAAALDRVGMADAADRPPHQLSAGERRRVAVATVLAMDPEVLVLDEPSSHLDPLARRELADLVRSLPLTLLLVTHDLPYALELCERAVLLDDGQLVADGRTPELLADDALLRAHRLELPFGFDPRATHP